ncbi:MAG: T9SS type A sorting domain-containing protein [Vicingaceae bacterium]
MTKLTFLISLLLFSLSSYCADYFWVGNNGNWSDLSHWANTSGGVGNAYVSLPTTTDNVFFDANSFLVAGDTIRIDIDASAANLDFTGVANSPVVDGVAAREITVGGSLTFIAGITHDFAGDYIFTSTGSVTISSATTVFNGDITFNGVGATFTLTDNLNVSDEIGLQRGTFDMAGFGVTANSIDANRGTNLRTLDFGGSAVTLTGTGTVLDLRGNTTNLSVIPTATTIDFTNTNNITVEAGNIAKTLPHLTFSNCTNTVRINTGTVEDNTERISFGNIIVSQDGARFFVDGNNDDNNIKTFQSVTLPNNCRYIIGSADGTGGFGGTNHTIIAGDFIVGNNCEGDVRGDFIEFAGNYDAGTRTDCFFIRNAQFIGDFIVDGTGRNHIIINRDTEFSNNILINGDATIRVARDVNVAGDIILATGIEAFINNSGAAAITTLSGTLSMNSESIINLGGGNNGLFILPTVAMAQKTQMNINNNSSLTTIGNLTLNPFSIVRFNTNGTTNITGTLTAPGTCDIWMWLKSITDGVQATVTFNSPQNTTYNICQDLNCSTANLTNTNGVNLSNNAGITFPSSISGTTYFWVGSTVGNNKLGAFSTGVNNDWSNPDNWSTVSGNYSGNNPCIPWAQDNVIFNAASFSAGAGNVNLDLIVHSCNDLTFTGIPVGCTMDASITTADRELILFGNISLHNNLDNLYEGLTTFSAFNGTTRTITTNGSNFFGRVEFDFIGGNWSLSDNLDMNGNGRADVFFRNGTVDANNRVWNLEDDWTVSGGTFTASTSTVIFDGPASQNSRQEVRSNNNSFYNFYVNRGANGGGNNDQVRLVDPLTINNDLFITRGALVDNGFQITGALSGDMEIENSARIILGRNNVSTLFPTNYITANIDLNDRGQTRYNSNVAQTISSVPVYGRLYLTNRSANPGFADKTLDGPITINDLLFIDGYNNLIDDGFQITGDVGERIQMNSNSLMTLGSAGVSTEFPLNYSLFDINTPSTIVYNSGLNQNVKSIAGFGDARYSNLTITNAAGAGTPIKTLEGDIIVRGNLTINSNNELDIDAANDFDIELQGYWINNSSFDEHQGLVSLTGDSAQVITSGGTEETFYNLTVANSNTGGVTIEDDISILNLLTFSDGVIYEGSGTNELVTIENGANVTGASNASHVDGRVEKIGSIAFDFPVGKSDLYRPISIGVPTVASTGFRAEYFYTTPQPSFDRNALAVTIDHVSDCEYWILDRTSLSGNANVTLTWAANSCGVTNLSDLIVARWDGNSWEDEGNNGATTGNNAAGTVTSLANVTAFSPFTLGSISADNPLPITLISFDAIATEQNTVELTWLTESEINNEYFTVEKSKDGIVWEKLLTMDGAGNSSHVITYNNVDYTPYNGTSYYRLLQTDFDGKYSYSNVVFVNFSNIEQLSVYPNPTNGLLNVSYKNNSLAEVLFNVYDVSGRLVESRNYQPVQEGFQKFKVNLRKLENGSYFYNLQIDGQIFNDKIFKIDF